MFECVFNNGKEISNPVVRTFILHVLLYEYVALFYVPRSKAGERVGSERGMASRSMAMSARVQICLCCLLVFITCVLDSDATCYFGSEMATPQRWWVFGMVDCVYRSKWPSFLSSIICDSFPSNTGIEITIGLTTYCQLIGPNIDRHNGKHSRAHHQIL